MRVNRSTFMITASIIIVFAVVIGFLIYGGEDLLGLTAADTNNLIAVLPGVFVLLVSFYAVSVSSGYVLVGAAAGVGLSLAKSSYVKEVNYE